MNELHFAYKVRQHLNRGLQEMPARTTRRLAIARQQALARQKLPVSQSILATVGNIVHFEMDSLPIKQILFGAAIIGTMVFSTIWITDQRANEVGTIESAMLSNDIPVNAFTDKGFNAWLKRSSVE